jgi:hypothetical protein
MRNYNLKKWSFDTEKTKFLSEQWNWTSFK